MRERARKREGGNQGETMGCLESRAERDSETEGGKERVGWREGKWGVGRIEED